MAVIGFLGLGAMGSRMVKHLLSAGHEVKVWNRTPGLPEALMEAGANWCDSPGLCASDADFVLSMVRDVEASKRVWLGEDGALSAMANDTIAIECSTLTPAWIDELNAKCSSQGVELLDAPVAGSRPQAEAGQLLFMVGGKEEAFHRVVPILNLMGAVVKYCGVSGSGCALKLMVNGMLGVQVAAISEMMAYISHSKVDLQTALEIFSHTPVCSPALKINIDSTLNGNFDPMFPVELIEKDLSYFLRAAETENIQVLITKTTKEQYSKVKEAGFGNLNLNAISKLYL